MIHSEAWIYDAQVQETLHSEISQWVTSSSDPAFCTQGQFDRKAEEYRQLMALYTCAMKTVRTKFDILNTEYNTRLQRNPIKAISTRLKRTTSLLEKLKKLNLEPTLDNVKHHLFDVAGVRVICSYMDDVYAIADALLNQKDVRLVQKKDYIVHPKENGYRSLHLIISVPVYFSRETVDVKVEVQIRTIAMDYWASMEHQLKYKKEIEHPRSIQRQLKACADVIHATDETMLQIRKQLEEEAQEKVFANWMNLAVPAEDLPVSDTRS